MVFDVVDNSQDAAESFQQDNSQSSLYNFLYPSKDLLPDDKEMSIFDHLEELRERLIISVLALGAAILGCFAFSKDLILFLEAPVSSQGVRFLQLSPGEFFFTTLKVVFVASTYFLGNLVKSSFLLLFFFCHVRHKMMTYCVSGHSSLTNPCMNKLV